MRNLIRQYEALNKLHKILQQHRPIFARSFRVELHTVEVFARNRSRERHAIISGGYSVFIRQHRIAMHKIEMAVLLNAVE